MRRQGNPSVLAPVVDRDRRRGKVWICKGSDRHGNTVLATLDLPVHSRSAGRTEVKDDSVAFIAHTDILLGPPLDFDRVGAKARLSADTLPVRRWQARQ